MARRRYISTNTSVDKQVNRLGTQYGDFAALLYLLMIPHAEDDATLTGDPDELLATVLPMRRDRDADDVTRALEGMAELCLIEWDREAAVVRFPAASFYKYQTYIPDGKRRGANNGAQAHEPPQDSAEEKRSAQFSAEQRKTPQNRAYPSPSPSPSPSPTGEEKHTANGYERDAFDGTGGRQVYKTPLATEKRQAEAAAKDAADRNLIAECLNKNPHWFWYLRQNLASRPPPPAKLYAYAAGVLRRWQRGEGTPPAYSESASLFVTFDGRRVSSMGNRTSLPCYGRVCEKDFTYYLSDPADPLGPPVAAPPPAKTPGGASLTGEARRPNVYLADSPLATQCREVKA